jgi:hypothetical protein
MGEEGPLSSAKGLEGGKWGLGWEERGHGWCSGLAEESTPLGVEGDFSGW